MTSCIARCFLYNKSMDKNSSKWVELGKTLMSEASKVAPPVLVEGLYLNVLYKHLYTDPLHYFNKFSYPELKSEEVKFATNDNNMLAGYFYHYDKFDDSKVIIFAHGYGNGHLRYIDVINYLCKNGFLVFAYNATAFDNSDGKGLLSFAQGIVDLSNAIKYVKEMSKYAGKEVYLIGHSWGGYSVGAVLNIFSTIKKVVIFSGFNTAADVVLSQGREYVGDKGAEYEKYIVEHDKKYFPYHYNYSVVEGLSDFDGKAIIVHSYDDNTVLPSASIDIYKKELGNNPNIKFITYKDRGHGTVYYTLEGKEYFLDIRDKYRKYNKENKNLTTEQKEEYLNSIIDKEKWADMLNHPLLDEIVKLFRD